MVFGWLKGASQRKFAEMQKKELLYFLDMVRGIDDREVGLLIAIATNFSNSNVDLCDFKNPLATTDGTVPLSLVRHYQKLQKEQNQIEAAGVAIWVHTIRTVFKPSNRQYARELWGELLRGMPHVEAASAEFQIMTGMELDTFGYHQVPAGYGPRDL